MKTWQEVADSDAFIELNQVDRTLARDQYFDEVIKPQVPEEDHELVKKLFDADTESDVKSQSAFGDMVDSFQEGVYQGVSGLGETSEQLFGVGEDLRDWGIEMAGAQEETMSPEWRKAKQQQIFSEDENGHLMLGDGAGNWRTWLAMFGNTAGQMADMMVPGGAFAKGAKITLQGAAAYRAAKKAQKIADAAGQKLPKWLQSANKNLAKYQVDEKFGAAINAGSFGIVESALAGGQAGIQGRDTVLAMPQEKLEQSPTYLELKAKHNGDTAKARNELAELTATAIQKNPILITSNFLLGSWGGSALENMLKGTLAKSRAAGAVKGFGIEGLTEGGQGAAEQYSVNVGVRDYADPTQSPTEGVLAAGMNEAVAGGGLGAFGGAAAKPRDNLDIIKEKVQGDISKLQDGGLLDVAPDEISVVPGTPVAQAVINGMFPDAVAPPLTNHGDVHTPQPEYTVPTRAEHEQGLLNRSLDQARANQDYIDKVATGDVTPDSNPLPPEQVGPRPKDGFKPQPIKERIEELRAEAKKAKVKDVNQYVIDKLYPKAVDSSEAAPAPYAGRIQKGNTARQSAIDNNEDILNSTNPSDTTEQYNKVLPFGNPAETRSEQKNKPVSELKKERAELVKLQKEKTVKPADVLAVIASKGGINRQHAEGIDPAEMNVRKGGIRPVFPVNGGMSMDEMGELLYEEGFFQGKRPDANEVIDMVNAAMAGQEFYRSGEQELKQQSDYDVEGYQRQIDAIDDAIEEQTTYASILAEQGQKAANDYIDNRRLNEIHTSESERYSDEELDERVSDIELNEIGRGIAELANEIIGAGIKTAEEVDGILIGMEQKGSTDAQITIAIYNVLEQGNKNERPKQNNERAASTESRPTAEKAAQPEGRQGAEKGARIANETESEISFSGKLADIKVQLDKAGIPNKFSMKQGAHVVPIEHRAKAIDVLNIKTDKAASNEAVSVSTAPDNKVTPAEHITEEVNKAAASPENDKPAPTKAQIEANNYAKGHPVVQGFNIAIENPAGTKRKPMWPAMAGHYGDLLGTVGADGDPVDVFLKPDADIPADNPVFIINQYVKGKFDEHKVMMGYASEEEASKAYNDSYTKQWKGLDSIHRVTPEQLRAWLENGNTKAEYNGSTKERRAEGKNRKERRTNTAKRKRVSEMSDEEKNLALLTNEKSGLRNERAYEEDKRLAHQSFFDIDNFKQINDTYTYDGADKILAAFGEIMQEAAIDGVTAYHLHGDEFIVQSDNEADLKKFSETVREELYNKIVTIELPNGEIKTATNVGASYGIAGTKEQAEANLKRDKAARAEAGLRTERDREPGQLPETAAEGKQDTESGIKQKPDNKYYKDPGEKPEDIVEWRKWSGQHAINRADESVEVEASELESIIQKYNDFSYETGNGKKITVSKLPDGREIIVHSTTDQLSKLDRKGAFVYTVVPEKEFSGETFTKLEGRKSGPKGFRFINKMKPYVVDKSIYVTTSEASKTGDSKEPAKGKKLGKNPAGFDLFSDMTGRYYIDAEGNRRRALKHDNATWPDEFKVSKKAAKTPASDIADTLNDEQREAMDAAIEAKYANQDKESDTIKASIEQFVRGFVTGATGANYEQTNKYDLSGYDHGLSLGRKHYNAENEDAEKLKRQVFVELDNKVAGEAKKNVKYLKSPYKYPIAVLRDYAEKIGVENTKKKGRHELIKLLTEFYNSNKGLAADKVPDGVTFDIPDPIDDDLWMVDSFISRDENGAVPPTKEQIDAINRVAKAFGGTVRKKQNGVTGNFFDSEDNAKRFYEHTQGNGKAVPVPKDAVDSVSNKPESDTQAELRKPDETQTESDYGKSNTVFTEDAAAKAREILKNKLGTLSAGIDPEIMQAGITLAGYHIEAGARKFADFAKAMVGDIGAEIKPYLQSLYEAVRHYPGVENKGMTPTDKMTDEFVDAVLDGAESKALNNKPAKASDDDVTAIKAFKRDDGLYDFMVFTGRKYVDKTGLTESQVGSEFGEDVASKIYKQPVKKWTTYNKENGELVSANDAEEQKETASSPGGPAHDLASRISEKITKGESISWRELFEMADNAYGGTQAEGAYSVKDAYDAMEMGLNLAVLDNTTFYDNAYNSDGNLPRSREALKTLHQMMERLPTQTKRTDEMDRLQQYSTPHTHSFVAAWVANLKESDIVLEPSAGTGNLATHAMNAGVPNGNIHVNELGDGRANLLRGLFDNVTQENATYLNSALPQDIKPTVVLMNPPFSADSNKPGKKDLLLGAKHVEQALIRLQDGGRLVAILGKGMAMDKPRTRDWWKKIKDKYNVRANIQVSGDEYRKFGTTFDNQFIVIDKTGKTEDNIITGEVDSVSDLLLMLNEVQNDRIYQNKRKPAESDVETAAGEMGSQAGFTDDLFSAAGERSNGPASERPAAAGSGGRSGNARPAATGKTGTGNAVPSDKRGGRESTVSPADVEKPATSGTSATASKLNQHADESGVEIENADVTPIEIGKSSFENYRSPIKINGAKQHPTRLSESAAMAAVKAPAVTYKPHISQAIIDSGRLSDVQLESIVRAGQSHSEVLPNGERKGFFIGDGTGVGKGAQVAGVIQDNIAQGRKKAVWVSENQKLFEDAKRDTSWVGGDVKKLFKQGSVNGDITAKDGVLFTTYDTLRSQSKAVKDASGKVITPEKTRLEQVIEWLGEDFDGVIAFDEAHNMANALDQKGSRGMKKASRKALAGVELQRRLPNARILYVSATGATEVENLGYTDRLGLWGEGTPFADKNAFVTNIKAGGVAAMEVVAKDMKAMGVYVSRSLSYDDVEYSTIEHALSEEQRETYDELAGAWQTVLTNVNEALENNGAITNNQKNGAAKSAALSAFWGSHQRFFNQILTGMQTPSVITDIEGQLEQGNSAVLQLVNTNEAVQERRMAQAADAGIDLDEVDITPRDILMQYVANGFPTNQYEEYTDDDDNIRSRPMVDSKGNHVQNPQSVAMREKLLDRIGALRVPEGPLEQIINYFGSDAVAEITGRKRRLVRADDGSVTEEKLGEAKAKKDADDFMEGKKRILIFSDAGGTGRSYHASNTAKNKQKRIHYLIQPGWRADKAVQGTGRTHRTNQAVAPHYKLVTTDIKAQRRFISTIARRLDQLGALTKGQRDTTSQGMFSADMNLEGQYGNAALDNLLRDINAGKVESITMADFEEQTGISVIDEETGQISETKKPTVPKFLNRLLSMKIEVMDRMFDAFYTRLESVIEYAKEQGTYDSGMETIQADAIRKVEEQYTSNKAVRYVKVELDNPAVHIEFDRLPANVKFARNKQSGKLYAFTDALSITDAKTGRIVNRMRRMSPGGGDYIPVSDFNAKYDPLKRESFDAEGEWNDDLAKLSKIKTTTKHLITGTMLPIWNKLPTDQPRIVRMMTDEREVLLGREIKGKDVHSVLKAVGIVVEVPDRSPGEWLNEVVNKGTTLELANGWKIELRTVSGEPRVEIIGASPKDANMVVSQGGFTERISFQTRLFLPSSDADVFARVLVGKPVVDFFEKQKNRVETHGVKAAQQRMNASVDEVVSNREPSAYDRTMKKWVNYAEEWGVSAAEDRARNSLAGMILGRELGESIEEFFDRKPTLAQERKATQDYLAGKRPENTDGPSIARPNPDRSPGAAAALFSGRDGKIPSKAESEGKNYTIEPGTKPGYVQVRFDDKPERDVIDKLKAAGYRWSMRNKVWYGKEERLPDIDNDGVREYDSDYEISGQRGTTVYRDEDGVASPVSAPGQTDMFAPEGKEASYRDKSVFDVNHVRVGTFAIGDIKHVRTKEDAAHILAPLRKNPVEHFAILVLDQFKRPIQVIRHTIGTIDGASVYPGIVAGAIHSNDNARYYYFAHNHPSGVSLPSMADKNITERINNILSGTGVDYLGHIIFGESGEAYMLSDKIENDGPIKAAPMARTSRIPVTERKYTRKAVKLRGPSLTSPVFAENHIRENYTDNGVVRDEGILVLDNRNHPIGFIPHPFEIGSKTKAKLRSGVTGSGASSLMRDVSKMNGASVIFISKTYNENVKNVGSLFSSMDIRSLDILYNESTGVADGKAALVSAANRGLSMKNEGPYYSKYSQSDTGVAPKGVSYDTVQEAIDEFKQAHNGNPKNIDFKIYPTQEAAFGKAGVKSLRAVGVKYIKGAYFGRSELVILIASDFHNKADVAATIRHEILAHHGLNTLLKGDKRAIIDRIKASRDEKSLKKLWAEIDRDYADQTEDIKAEELLARIAEHKPSRMSKLWNDLVQLVKRALRNIGWINDTNTYTKGELQAFISGISESIKNGAVQQFYPSSDASQFNNETQPLFYSQLHRVLADKLPGKGTGMSFLKSVEAYANKGEFKAEELEWSGLQEWLKDNAMKKLTKSDVLDYLTANQIQIKEVEYGGLDSNSMRGRIESIKTYLQNLGLQVSMDYEGYPQGLEGNDGTPSYISFEDTVGFPGEENGLFNDSETAIPDDAMELMNRGMLDEYLTDLGIESTDETAEKIAELYTLAKEVQLDNDMGGDGSANGTNYHDYTLPGGENYTELLLTLPTAQTYNIIKNNGEFVEEVITEDEAKSYIKGRSDLTYVKAASQGPQTGAYHSSHWTPANVLAHVRFNDRIDADGKKVLFIEEIQSDWHQNGRKKGYIDTGVVKERSEHFEKLYKKYDSRDWVEIRDKLTKAEKAEHARLNDEIAKKYDAVPNAPFKTTWPMLVMKRMIRHAAENGYDRIAWTTGEQQNERWNLSNFIDSLGFERIGGLYDITAAGGDKDVIGYGMDEYELAEMVGQDVAKRIIEKADELQAKNDQWEVSLDEEEGGYVLIDPNGEYYRDRGVGILTYETEEEAKRSLERNYPISGMLNLKDTVEIGGEGMKGFYDNMLPKMINKYVKKWGAKVGETNIFTTSDGKPLTEYEAENDNISDYGMDDVDVHSLDITDAMRESAMQGQPLFNRKRQASQTETPEFKAWFGDSKVVDENGGPMVVYHGTADNISEFDPYQAGKNFDGFNDKGVFFTNNPYDASLYAKNADKVKSDNYEYGYPNVLPVYLSFKNPLILKEDTDGRGVHWITDTKYKEEIEDALYGDKYDGVIAIATDIHLRDDMPGLNGGNETIFVAKSTEQIKSSVGNSGSFDPNNPDIRFNRSAGEVIQDARQQSEALDSFIDSYENAKSVAKQQRWGLLTMRQVAEVISKHLPSMKSKFVPEFQRMEITKNNWKDKGGRLAEHRRGFGRERSEQLSVVQHEATIAGVDPSYGHYVQSIDIDEAKRMIRVKQEQMRGLGGDAEALRVLRGGIKELEMKIGKENNREKAYPAIARLWSQLDNEQKQQFKDERDYHKDLFKAQREAIKQRIVDTIEDPDIKRSLLTKLKAEFEQNQVEEPYFPLARFGDYFVYAEIDGEKTFDMFTSEAAKNRFLEQVREGNGTVLGHGLNMKDYNKISEFDTGFLIEVDDRIHKLGNSPIIQELRDGIYQLYLQTLPGMSSRKHQIHRSNRKGYHKDQLRGFADAAVHGANSLARMKHGHLLKGELDKSQLIIDIASSRARMADMEEQIADMEEQLLDPGLPNAAAYRIEKQVESMREKVDLARQIHDNDKIDYLVPAVAELRGSYDAMMNPKTHPISSTANAVGFTWFLGASISSAVVNLFQTPVISYPMLSAKFGYGASTKAFKSAYSAFVKGKGSIESQLSEDEKAAYAFWHDTGLLTTTLSHDLAGISDEGIDTGTFKNKFMRTVSYMFHHAEVINREVTALAAYRAAKASGKSSQEAMEIAEELTWSSHFDYTSGNRARFMRGNVMRVITQFKQYSQNITYLYGRTIHEAFRGESREIQKEARKALYGMLTGQMLVAGGLGMPMATIAMAIAQGLSDAFGDDDDPIDVEAEIRSYLADSMGVTGGRFVAKGVFDAFTPFAVSGRLSLSDLWIRTSDADLEGRAHSYDLMKALLGPMASIFEGAVVGTDLITQGEVQRGVEYMLPKAIKDGVKAARFATEDARTMSGRVIREMGPFEALAQLSGFSNSELGDIYSSNTAIQNVKKKRAQRRSDLIDALIQASDDRDLKAIAAARKAINEWNTTGAGSKIDSEAIKRRRSGMRRRSNEMSHGVYVSKGDRDLLDKYDYAE